MGCGGGKKEDVKSTKTGGSVPKTNGQTNQRQSGQKKQSATKGDTKLTPSAKLPGNFPNDVTTIGVCKTANTVRSAFMINFHVEGKTVKEIASFILADMKKKGWESAGNQVIKDNRAILALKKEPKRTCGYTISDFVLDSSGKKNTKFKGVGIQTKAIK